MKAEVGINPSYIWRSLVWGRDLLAKGLCWRVGNGQNIYAFSDSWILSLPQFKCLRKPLDSQMMSVSNFILPSGYWNKGLVRQNFLVLKTEAILNIPLNRLVSEDIRFWMGSPNGKYSVKLGYHRESNGFISPSHQSAYPLKWWWQFVWNLCIRQRFEFSMERNSKLHSYSS